MSKIRLAEAAKRYGLTVASLRKEAARGRLKIFRVANKDYTTLEEIDRMFEQCQIPPKEPACGYGQQLREMEKSYNKLAGSSSTEADTLARDALLARVAKLKRGSQRI
jgi:hypothetical protein